MMPKMAKHTALTALMMLLAAACGGADGAPTDATPEPQPQRPDVGKPDRVDVPSGGGTVRPSDDPRPASGVELKLMVAPAQHDLAERVLGLDWDAAEHREVSFYDDAARTLYGAGLILRARDVKGDDDDSTVKLRPFAREQIDLPWFGEAGFKCELDRGIASGSAAKTSCSLTVVQGEGEIADVADGKRSIKKLFSSAQEALVARYVSVDPWTLDLHPVGPVKVRRLRFEPSALGGATRVTVERWRLPDGQQLIEISSKTDAASADALAAKLRAWLSALGIDVDAPGVGKTYEALF
ncbi:MAG: hypothetical protein KC503_46435 [Myxococcales bacterium]|nr:hypothetical protein [Myxococcales bacterium]